MIAAITSPWSIDLNHGLFFDLAVVPRRRRKAGVSRVTGKARLGRIGNKIAHGAPRYVEEDSFFDRTATGPKQHRRSRRFSVGDRRGRRRFVRVEQGQAFIAEVLKVLGERDRLGHAAPVDCNRAAQRK